MGWLWIKYPEARFKYGEQEHSLERTFNYKIAAKEKSREQNMITHLGWTARFVYELG